MPALARAQNTTAGQAQASEPPVTDHDVLDTLFENGDHPDLLDGTLSVEGDMIDDALSRSRFQRQLLLGPWFAFKKNLEEQTGLRIGGSYGVLWQNYSTSLIGVDDAVGSKFTLNLSYDVLNRGRPDALTFDMAVEDRRPLGTPLAPLQAGLATGSAVPTVGTWGDFSIGVTQAYFRQSLFDNRFQYAVGKLFAPNFVDAYPLFDDNRQFLSLAFTTSPTIPVPLRGFGAVAAGYPTSGNLYVKGGIFTTRSSDTGSTISDFFTVDEHFYFTEIGWSGSAGAGVPIQARGPMDANNVHLTLWYRDPLENGSPRAYGLAWNANFTVGDRAMWFLRGGWSDGWLADLNFSGGWAWRPANAPTDMLGVAVGWVRPSNRILNSQWTAETFYRFQITRNVALTPDLQYVINPTLNPTKNSLFVFSFRTRVSF